MSYHGVGAGPGPVATYKVDAPWPWGDNTEIALPLQQMVNDGWNAISPKIDALESKLIQDAETELSLYAPKLAKDIMDTVVMPEVNNEVEVMMATLDMMKADLGKAIVIAGITMAAAVGLGAWWIKKGR